MENVCRLCAVAIEPHETRLSINANIEQMLISTCGWNSYRHHDNLPRIICQSCCLLLKQFWNFQISVAQAQKELYKKAFSFELTKSTVIDEVNADDGAIDELVELNAVEEHSINCTLAESNNTQMNEEIAQNEPQERCDGMEPTQMSKPVFECYLCRKRISTRSNLVRHMKLHVARPFMCDECDKDFVYRSHLKEHMVDHLNKRTYACDVCKRTFIAKLSPKWLSFVFKPGFRFKCSDCEFIELKESYMNHLMNVKFN